MNFLLPFFCHLSMLVLIGLIIWCLLGGVSYLSWLYTWFDSMKCQFQISENSVKRPFSLFYFFKKVLCGPFLKSVLNLLQYCFYVLVSQAVTHEGSQVPRLGIKSAASALEDEVLTTCSPGKSWYFFFIFQYFRTMALTIMALMEENQLEIKKKKCVLCRMEQPVVMSHFRGPTECSENP